MIIGEGFFKPLTFVDKIVHKKIVKRRKIIKHKIIICKLIFIITIIYKNEMESEEYNL